MLKKLSLIILIFVFAALSVSADDFSGETDYTVKESSGKVEVNWASQVVRVTGTGFGPENVKSLSRRKVLAKRAATVDAARNVLETIKGMRINSSKTVDSMMRESDVIKSKTEGLVRGMRTVAVNYTSDGACEVTVEVNISRDGKFLLENLDNTSARVIDNYPKFDWVALQKELERKKIELARTRSDLKNTKEKLAVKNRELEDAHTQLASLKNALVNRGTEFTSMDSALASGNPSREELQTMLHQAEEELARTKQLIERLKNALEKNRDVLTENDNDPMDIEEYLTEKDRELDRISIKIQNAKESELSPEDNAMKEIRDYVNSLKQVQEDSSEKVEAILTSTDGETPVITPEETAAGGYTGLLIDARDLTVKPALAPSILNERGEKLYGLGVIPSEVTSGAIACYITGQLTKAKLHAKIGTNPLVIRGVKSANGSDVIIKNEDIEKMAGIYDLLEEAKVAILM